MQVERDEAGKVGSAGRVLWTSYGSDRFEKAIPSPRRPGGPARTATGDFQGVSEH